MLADNVVELNTDNMKVYDQIQRYFEKLERKSVRTREKYEGDIRFYFRFMWDKEIEHLQVEDMQLTLDDFEDYIKKLTKMKKKGERIYSNKTVNGKITSIRGLIKYLAAKKIVSDISYFPLIEHLPNTSESYDALTVDEVLQIAEFASNEKQNGRMKQLLLWFALDTSIRKSAILSLRWSNFIERDFDYEIRGIDKNNKRFTKQISKQFYQWLLEIKTDSKYVFPIPKPTLDKMFERNRDKMGFPPERKIVFHSIRKAGASFFYSTSGKDLDATRDFLGHSSPNTTVLYTKPKGYGATGAISIRDSVDKDLYKIIDHQTLLGAIEQLDSGQIMLLNKKIMELLEI